ncbi:radical SAM protein [Lacrimispora brassicae]
MRYHNLIAELMFIDDACNLRCQYCTAPLKPIPTHNGIHTLEEYGGNIIELDASAQAQLGIKMRRHVNKALEIGPTPILSVIGGELTLIHGISDFIQEVSPQYDLIILTTNGVCLDRAMIDSLSQCKNLLLYFSLDGYTFEMNSYRVTTKRMSDQLLKNLQYCLERGIKVEVQSVLHDRNIEQICGFAEYLLPYAEAGHYLKLVPFPVRWTKGEYKPADCQLLAVEDLLANFDKYRKILPPQSYLSGLAQFLKNGRRPNRCYVPYIVYGIDHRGRVKSCPCIPAIVSSINKEPDIVRADIAKEKVLYSGRTVNSGFCHTCFEGGWEILNGYLQGSIGKNELQGMAIGQVTNVFDVLGEIQRTMITDDVF